MMPPVSDGQSLKVTGPASVAPLHSPFLNVFPPTFLEQHRCVRARLYNVTLCLTIYTYALE